MACIKSVPRSALVAFAPDAPYLATGTMAGAVDLSFSSSATLEIFKLDFQSDAYDLPLAGACPSAERFNRLSWGKPESASEDYSLGLVAGGLGDGSISVWNPLKLINSSEDQNSSYVAQLENHTGPVRGLEFSAISPNLLASGADEGELCIWDLANPLESTSYPPLKSAGSGAQTEVSFVSWNPKFQHILASTSYNGMTVVWDLKQQKPVTSFSDSTRRRCSVLQWNPDISTQLIVASDDDSSPSLRVWDVRKTISPIREFVGHTKGVIAMSWCPYDSSFLLTCAKDNRTICWDTVAGEIVCELPASTNWNFDVHWYPKIPGVISASSFDVKVGIYNIQACDKLAVGEREVTTPARLRAPKWLKRPVGVSFGFGGKLISFRPGLPAAGAPPGAPTSSEVYVQNLVTEHSLVSRSNEFEAAIQDGAKSSLQLLCEKKSQDSVSEDEKETWGFLKVMFEKERRKRLLTHLGFSVPNEGFDNAIDEIGRKLASTNSFNERGSNGAVRVGEEDAAFLIDKGEEFFNNPQPSVDNVAIEDNEVANNKQTKKAPEEQLESIDPSVDESIQRALVVGDYKGAVLQSIAANRIADALVIAHVGGPSLWEITRDQYLKSSPSPYIKVVSALVTKDLKGLVSTRPLNLWKETLALLCTLSQGDEWSDHCDTLASRLMAVGNTLAATLCYICAENIEKTVEIWSLSLKTEYDGRTFVDLLQDLMEKTIVLALATGQKRFSASLSKLVENYAELLVSQGLLSTAIEYLQLLGSEGLSHEFATLRDRIEVSAAEKEASQTLPYNNSLQQPDSLYAARNSSFDVAYHQPVVHPDGGYQQTPAFQMAQPQQVQPSLYVPSQQVQSLMYVPSQRQQVQPPIYSSQPQQVQQFNFSAAPVPQPAVRSFTPATPSKKVGQFQPSTLASQLYPGAHNDIHQHGPVDFPPGRPLSTFSDKGLIPAIAPQSFVPRSTANPAQPSSPTQLAQLQSVVTPPPPPPTVQTVDTSKVPAELRAVITTLTRLYHETSAAVGGPHANPSKKREIEDNSKRIGALYAKLNSGDISPNAASKLSELCQALDAGDFGGALHIQVLLTTKHWDECDFWLSALKRMIKTRQSFHLN